MGKADATTYNEEDTPKKTTNEPTTILASKQGRRVRRNRRN